MRRPAPLITALALALAATLTATSSPAHASPTADNGDGEVLDVVVTILDVRPQVVDIAARTAQGTEVVLGADVLFAFGSAQLPAQVDELLTGVLERAAANPGRIVVAGHTDGIGDEASNQALSEQRARAVGAYLGERVSAALVESVGYGETQPLRPEVTAGGEDDPAARATNRRVTITFAGS